MLKSTNDQKEKVYFILRAENILMGFEIKSSAQKIKNFISPENLFVKNVEDKFECKITLQAFEENQIVFNVENYIHDYYLILFEFRKKLETKFITERMFYKNTK